MPLADYADVSGTRVTYHHHLHLIEHYHQRCLHTILNIHWCDFVIITEVLEKWWRLPASRLCSSKHSFTGQDMSARWKTITYQRSCYMENCPLALVTEEYLGKDTKTLCRGPSPLTTSIKVRGQRKQPIARTMHNLPSHHFLWNHTKGQHERQKEKKTKPGPFWNHHWTDRDERPLFKDLPILDRFHQPSACLHQTKTSSFMNLHSWRIAMMLMILSLDLLKTVYTLAEQFNLSGKDSAMLHLLCEDHL